MQTFVIFALVGLAGQFVSGTLGMGYGITSTTLLLAIGTTPAVASASVHLAQTGTAVVSGLAHWRFRNIDWRTVALIAGPGVIGALLGAYVLTSLPVEIAKPWMAALLLVLGCYVLVRFSFLTVATRLTKPRPGIRMLGPLGLLAGFVDSTGGGGWGPVATTALLSSGRLEPRKVVGSVGTAEVVVSLAASIGFVVALANRLPWLTVLGLLAGGVIVAPLAAWLVRILPARILGSAAGCLIVLTNAGIMLGVFGLRPGVVVGIYLMLVLGCVAALAVAFRSLRAERRTPVTVE